MYYSLVHPAGRGGDGFRSHQVFSFAKKSFLIGANSAMLLFLCYKGKTGTRNGPGLCRAPWGVWISMPFKRRLDRVRPRHGEAFRRWHYVAFDANTAVQVSIWAVSPGRETVLWMPVNSLHTASGGSGVQQVSCASRIPNDWPLVNGPTCQLAGRLPRRHCATTCKSRSRGTN